MRFDDLYEQVGPSVEGPMPMLVLSDGWLEAADTLLRVRDCLLSQTDLTTIAQFDTDQLLDHRARRPLITVVDGVTQGVQWPVLELAIGTDQDDQPFLLLHGPEPDFAWRQFGKAVANITTAIGVTTTFSMGAYPAAAPHTRPVRISSTASDAHMLIGREHTTGRLSVPVGVIVAITEELEKFDIPSHGLYAQVPYYLAAQEWPQAAIGLIDTFADLAGLRFDTTCLQVQVDDAVASVTAMLDETPSMNEVVAKLEHRHDELKKLEDEPLPSGDELEKELQQYLRKIDDEA